MSERTWCGWPGCDAAPVAGQFRAFCQPHADFHADLHRRWFTEHGAVRKAEAAPAADEGAPSGATKRIPRATRATWLAKHVERVGRPVTLAEATYAAGYTTRSGGVNRVLDYAVAEGLVTRRGRLFYPPGAAAA